MRTKSIEERVDDSTAANSEPWFIAIGGMCWGTGPTPGDAKAECRLHRSGAERRARRRFSVYRIHKEAAIQPGINLRIISPKGYPPVHVAGPDVLAQGDV